MQTPTPNALSSSSAKLARPAPLSDRQKVAAYHLAGGLLSKQAIAAKLGITPTTLSLWQRREDFQALVRTENERVRQILHAEYLTAWRQKFEEGERRLEESRAAKVKRKLKQ